MKYQLLRFCWRLVSFIPFPVIYFLSDVLFYPLYYAIRYRRRVVRKNLTESFPEKTANEIVTLEKQFYRFFLDTLFEMCKYASISEKEIRERMKFTNIEEVNNLLQDGKSISLYLGHCGNWEWVSSMPLHLHKEAVAAQVYHKIEDKDIDRLLLENRSRFGAVNVEMRSTARWISSQVKEQKVTITGYIADQSPRKREIQHYLQFFNHETPALIGTEKITKRYGMTAYYLDIKRIKRGYYEARFTQLHEQPDLLPDFELTEMYFDRLEKTIKRQPELYLWTHNRFKHSKKKQNL